MPEQIAAKMTSWSDPVKENESERVQLNAVYADKGINKEWAKYTPAGQLSLTIDNPKAQGFFKKGVEYMVTIREALPGE